MKIEKFKTKEEWENARKGRVTGTKLGNLVMKRGTGKKKGFYEIIAERVAIPHNGENVMDRGLRLEEFAIERFAKETGKKVNTDLVIFSREDDSNIAYSPDAYIGKKEDVEVKCLNSASHIEAFLTKQTPSEYVEQIIQGFIVNDDLETRYLVFYDPRMPVDFFYLTITRESLKKEIAEYFEMEKSVLAEIAKIEELLTF